MEEKIFISLTRSELETIIIDCVNSCLKHSDKVIPANIEKTPIERLKDFPMSGRLYNALYHAYPFNPFKYIEEISIPEFRRQLNVGPHTIDELIKILSQYNQAHTPC